MTSQSAPIPGESDRSFLEENDDCLLETGSFADDDGFDADDLLRSPLFGDPKVSSRFNVDEEDEDDEGIVGENALTNMLDDDEDVSDVDLHSDLGEELDVLDDDDMICGGEETNLQNSLTHDLIPFEAIPGPSRTQSASYTTGNNRTTAKQGNIRSQSFNEGTKSTNVAMKSFSPRVDSSNVRRNVTPVAPVRTSSSHGRLPLPFPRIHEGTSERSFQQDDKNASTFRSQQEDVKMSNFSQSDQKLFSHSPRRASSSIVSMGSVSNDGSVFYPSGLSGTTGSSTRGPFRSLSASAVIPALNIQDSKNLLAQQPPQGGSSGSVDVMQLQHHQSQQQQILLQQQHFQIQQQQLERQRQIQIQQEQAQQQQLHQEQIKLQQMQQEQFKLQQMQQEQLKLRQLQQQQFQQEQLQQQHQLQQHILQQQQQQLQQQQLQQQQMHQQQMHQQQLQQQQIVQQAHMSPEQQIIQHQQQMQMQQIPMQQQTMQQQIALQQLNIQQHQQQMNQQQQEQHHPSKQQQEQLSVQQQHHMSFQQHSLQQLALQQQQMQTTQLPSGPAQGLNQQQLSMQLPVQVQQQLQIQLSSHRHEVIKQSRPLGLSQTIHNGSFSLRPPQRANSLNNSAQSDHLKIQEVADVISSIPYFTPGNDNIGVLRSNSVSNAVSTDMLAPNAMLGSFESTNISGKAGAPTINEAMEKLCDSMKRSAMSRSIIKQLSGSGLGQNSSLFLLAKQNSNHTLPTRQLSDVGLGVGNLLGDSSHRTLGNERGSVGSIVHSASIARY